MKKRGTVFVSYAREDRERTRPLVELLDAELRRIGGSIVWDEHLRAGAGLNNAIYKLVRDAACVLAIWTHKSVVREWVQGECEQARKDGRLVPVRLDADAEIRPPFNIKNTLDLSDWQGGKTRPIKQLLASVLGLVKCGARAVDQSVADDTWALEQAGHAVDELSLLAGQFRSVREALRSKSPARADLAGALNEVMDTVKVVRRAVKSFLRPALKQTLDAEPYLEIAYGDVPEVIEKGRGHCGEILVHYGRYGGIRDEVIDQLTPDKQKELDATFERLGTADGDLFEQLTHIGALLEGESRIIVNLMLSRREQDARIHVLKARELLDPFEQKLSNARSEMREIQASLGIA